MEVTPKFPLNTHAQFEVLRSSSVFLEVEVWRNVLVLCQRNVIEFLTAEKLIPNEIHHCLKAVYGDDTAVNGTVKRWVVKFGGWEPGKAIIVNKTRSRHPITALDDRLINSSTI